MFVSITSYYIYLSNPFISSFSVTTLSIKKTKGNARVTKVWALYIYENVMLSSEI